MKIAILLATYNSEKYLREQLDSLFRQSNNNFTLYVRDDGSNDNTLCIIAEYQKEHHNIVVLEDDVQHRGPMLGFMWLLENVSADYYMFCDHDDVWLDDKIEVTLNKIRELEAENPSKAVVVNTDLMVVDQDLNVINPSMWRYANINRELSSSFETLVFGNSFTGCTMILNNLAKNLSLPIHQKAYMHDWWIPLRVSYCGGVLGSVDQSTIMYRQHSCNTVGIVEYKKLTFMDRIKKINVSIQHIIDGYKTANMVGRVSVFQVLLYKIKNMIKVRLNR